MNKKEILRQGLFTENPVFVLLLGMCPTLGVTMTLQNAIGMGLSVLFVLLFFWILLQGFHKYVFSF